MKKVLVTIIAGVMATLVMTGCGNGSEKTKKDNDGVNEIKVNEIHVEEIQVEEIQIEEIQTEETGTVPALQGHRSQRRFCCRDLPGLPWIRRGYAHTAEFLRNGPDTDRLPALRR